MHIVVNCLSGNLIWGLEETTNINIEAKVCETTGDDFCSSVVAVLSHFSDKNSWVSALVLCEVLHVGECRLVLYPAFLSSLLGGFLTVCATDDGVLGNVSAEDLLKGVADLSYSCSVLGSLNSYLEQVALTSLSSFGKSI